MTLAYPDPANPDRPYPLPMPPQPSLRREVVA